MVMKKLIELLNEYEKKNGRNFEVKEIGMTYRNNDLMIISKRYGFIKWLVDNDKIDKDIVRKKAKYLVLTNGLKYYEWLIMELSIQDSPIEFLISILK